MRFTEALRTWKQEGRFVKGYRFPEFLEDFTKDGIAITLKSERFLSRKSIFLAKS